MKKQKLDNGKAVESTDKPNERTEEISDELLVELEEVDSNLMELDKECAKEQMIIQRKFDEKKKPIFEKRREIIEKIPKFWAKTISKHPVFIENMQDEDIDILEHLKDIELDDNLDDEGSYRIKLTFDDSVSKHMEPSVLVKHVVFQDGAETVKEFTKIKWKSESPKSRISKRLLNEGSGKEEDDLSDSEIFSFFDFFTDEINGDGIDIGDIIRRDIYHSPLFYFCDDISEDDINHLSLMPSYIKVALNDELVKKFKPCRVFKDAITPISCMDWSEDGDSLLICENDILRVYTISSGDISKTHHSRKNGLDSVKFAHSNKLCIVASNKVDGDSAVRIWDIQENKYLRALKLSSNIVNANGISIHPNKDLFIACTDDSKATIYNFKLDNPISVRNTRNKYPVSTFDPDGRTFAIVTDDQMITVYDCKTFSPFDTFNLSNIMDRKDRIEHIVFSPNGRSILVKTNNGRIFTISSFRGGLIHEYKVNNRLQGNHFKSKTKPIFSSDSQFVLQSLDDANIHLWSANTGRLLNTFHGHIGQPTCISFNPKKALFASACINLIWWRLEI
ncbi:hypothetical protein FG386_002168 [Cryptosporidium ryanae]|uniref:uncharacterized protein n=1 Tax=Cryptosporidium ryanae TaxID=515981 RepID=UPI00351A370C|nr:hypothetical protein FG386_002168 [Cryptosporidium ryanae]